MLKLNFNPFPILETERLILRQLRADDEDALFIMRSDEQVNKYIDRPLTKTIEEVREFIGVISENTKRNEGLYWIITMKDSDAVAGSIVYWNIVPEKDQAEVGYTLMPGYEGKGIMHEALNGIMQYGFDTLKLERIEAYTHKDNERSKRLLERNSFVRDEEAENMLTGDEAGILHVYALMRPTQ